MFDLVITNATIVLETGWITGSVAVKDGKIAAITDNAEEINALKIINADRRVIFPGAIDTHAHFFEPWSTDKGDDFYTGTCCAAAGGFTTSIEMPQSIPPVINAQNFFQKLRIAKTKAVVDFALWGGLIPSSFQNLKELHNLGCTSFKAFTSDAGPDYGMLDDFEIYRAMQLSVEIGTFIGFHAENDQIITRLENEFSEKGCTGPEYHEASRPYIAELEAISRLLLFAKETGAKLHICHLSIPEGAEIIKQARSEGVNVSVETCSHYLLLNKIDIEKFGSYAKCNPPLRSQERVEKLWDYVLNGTINCVGSDHAAYSESEKDSGEGVIFRAPGGFPGLQVILCGLLDEGVKKRGMNLSEFSRLTSTNAAKIFGLYPKKGSISIGADADFVIVDTNKSWEYCGEKSYSKVKSKRYPYEAKKFSSKIWKTIVRGTTVYEDDAIKVVPGYGQFVKKLIS